MIVHERVEASGRFLLGEGQHLPEHRELSVRIEQLGSGRIFLYCPADDRGAAVPFIATFGDHISFEGTADDHFPLRTSQITMYIGTNADWQCFALSQVTIGNPTETPDIVEATLTNVIFEENRGRTAEFTVSAPPVACSIHLCAVANYDDLVLFLRQTDYPAATAKLTFAPNGLSRQEVDAVVDDACATLSLIQGRRIEWIQKKGLRTDGTVLWRELGETVTKRFNSSLFCFDPDRRRGIGPSFGAFDSVFPVMREFHRMYDSQRSILHGWLDARLQEDYLEARTLKYVIVLEALCRLVECRNSDVACGRVPKGIWRAAGKQFLPRIDAYLRSVHQVEGNKVDDICSTSNWGNLNRESFRITLTRCLDTLGIAMHDGPNRLSRVIDVRNKIVHSLSYLTDADFENLRWPAVDKVQQHFLVACFVDEVVLRIFGLGELVSQTWIAGFRAHRD